MAKSDETDLEQTTREALHELGSMNGIAPKRLFQDYVIPYVEAVRSELEEDMAEIADVAARDDLLEHGLELALNLAAFSVKLGQETGLMDDKGNLTDKASEELHLIHKQVSQSHAEFVTGYGVVVNGDDPPPDSANDNGDA